MRTSRISDSAVRERQLREAAAIEAETLFASHGGGAIAILSARLVDPSRDPEQRRGDRLTLLAIERLDRIRRQGSPGSMAGTLVVWKPAFLSRAWFGALFGRKPKRRR